MCKRFSLMLLLCSTILMGCSVDGAPPDLSAELREMRRLQHVHIGFIDEPREMVQLIEPNQDLNGGTTQVKLPPPVLASLRRESARALFEESGRSLASPDGRLIVRSQAQELMLDTRDGKQHSIARWDRIIGPVHWSPDSAFLLYVERATKWDSRALRILDNVVYVTVYRCRDGQKGRLRAFGEGAASRQWGWLQIPPALLNSR